MLMKHADRTIDTSGLNCPLPILRAKQILSTMAHGQVLHIIATDPDAKRDFEAYSRKTGHTLLDITETDHRITIWLRKR